MKGIIITILIMACVGGGLWQYAQIRHAQIEAENAARRAAQEQAVREERLALFGEAALDPQIRWSDSGLGILIYELGDGVQPQLGSEVTFNYKVTLRDGTQVDRTTRPTEARIGQMIPGVSAGLQQIKGGGRALLFIPPRLGYGRRAFGPIPADSGLLFEIELLKF